HLLDDRRWSLSSRVVGEPFEVIDIDRYRAVAEPELTVQRDPDGRWQILGEARLAEALLALEGGAVTTVQPSGDVVVHGAGAEPSRTVPALPLAADLTLALDDVAFRGFGATA